MNDVLVSQKEAMKMYGVTAANFLKISKGLTPVKARGGKRVAGYMESELLAKKSALLNKLNSMSAPSTQAKKHNAHNVAELIRKIDEINSKLDKLVAVK